MKELIQKINKILVGIGATFVILCTIGVMFRILKVAYFGF